MREDIKIIDKAVRENRELISVWTKDGYPLYVTLKPQDIEKFNKDKGICTSGFTNLGWAIKPDKKELKEGRKEDLLRILDDCIKQQKKVMVLIKNDISGSEKMVSLMNRYEIEKFYVNELCEYDTSLTRSNSYILGYWQF